jgi:hypothetical protein
MKTSEVFRAGLAAYLAKCGVTAGEIETLRGLLVEKTPQTSEVLTCRLSSPDNQPDRSSRIARRSMKTSEVFRAGLAAYLAKCGVTSCEIETLRGLLVE